MAVHTFVNSGAGVTIGTSNTDVYSTPVSTQATIHSIFVTNLKTTTVTASLYIYDNSAAATSTILLNSQIEAGNVLVIDKPLNVMASDKLRASCAVSGDVSVFASILEIS